MRKLEGKVALVSGAGRGIGRAIGMKLAEEGAGAVYLLCLPESNYISGETLVCSGGFRM